METTVKELTFLLLQIMIIFITFIPEAPCINAYLLTFEKAKWAPDEVVFVEEYKPGLPTGLSLPVNKNSVNN